MVSTKIVPLPDGLPCTINTHVADPDDLVGRGVRADLAGEVDVATLGDAASVDVRAEGEDHSGRI